MDLKSSDMRSYGLNGKIRKTKYRILIVFYVARRIRILLGNVWRDKSVCKRHETPSRLRLSIVRLKTEIVNESTEFMQGNREGFGGLGRYFYGATQIDTKFKTVIGLFKNNWHRRSIINGLVR